MFITELWLRKIRHTTFWGLWIVLEILVFPVEVLSVRKSYNSKGRVFFFLSLCESSEYLNLQTACHSDCLRVDVRHFIKEHRSQIVSMSLPAITPLSPDSSTHTPHFNEAISFTGTLTQNNCVVLINTLCLIATLPWNFASSVLHDARSCHGDLAVPRFRDSPFSGPISPPTYVIAFEDSVWIWKSNLVTPAEKAAKSEMYLIVKGKRERKKCLFGWTCVNS